MSAVIDRIKTFAATAPVNVEALIESFGIVLSRKAELDPDVAGELCREDSSRFRISANGADHYYRRRFTMAHELGHFLFHRDLIGAGVDDNRAYRSVKGGNFFNPNITAEHETEANRFASNLLMPAALVRQYHSEYGGDIAKLSNKFQVSQEAIGYRLQSLGL
jgi:Zn-dependent peptidase ImmA (M78 family)